MEVSISNYGNYSNDNYGSCRVVNIGELQFYFSYETIIAFRDENGLKISKNIWSTTTGKHLNWIDDDKNDIKITVEVKNQ